MATTDLHPAYTEPCGCGVCAGSDPAAASWTRYVTACEWELGELDGRPECPRAVSTAASRELVRQVRAVLAVRMTSREEAKCVPAISKTGRAGASPNLAPAA